MSEARFQIVLVEDTELDVFLIRQALEQAGLRFELCVLGNGEDALEFISKTDSDKTVPLPHLIILDLNLPRVNGGQVLERVRQSLRLRSHSSAGPNVVGLAQGQSYCGPVQRDSVLSKIFQTG
jgi:CheY-like chemotaxis protein